MLISQAAFTVEIDDVEAAVAEIQEQLDVSKFKTHNLGLVSALPAFIESGVVAALQEALPFDLVGQSTIGASSAQSDDLDQLSLLVLSSDDVEFSIAVSSPITGETTAPVSEAYGEASTAHSEKPVFILGYFPLLHTASGDYFLNAMNEASGGVPLFGCLAVDDTIDYHKSVVLYKDQSYSDQFVCVLFYGDVTPRYYVRGIACTKIIDEMGVVTSSLGSQLQTVDDAPVSEFLKGKGIEPNDKGEFVGINSFPYLVDYNDGTEPVVRAMFAVTPEGYAVCGGDIPVGATLGVSFFDGEEIKEGSKAMLDALATDIAAEGANAILVFSCIGRYFNLDFNTDAEAQFAHEAFDASGIPYLFSYSGGELCPLPSAHESGSLINRAHNNTIIAVTL